MREEPLTCLDMKGRTPTGTFLSKTRRNAATLGVRKDSLDPIRRSFKLFRDLGACLRHYKPLPCHRCPVSPRCGSGRWYCRSCMTRTTQRAVDYLANLSHRAVCAPSTVWHRSMGLLPPK